VKFPNFLNRISTLRSEGTAAKALVRESLKNPFSFNIDIVDTCNLRCVICPRGVYYKDNTSDRMDLGLFNRLLDKISSECECKYISLYNWTEPFLHPELRAGLEKLYSCISGKAALN